jgi:hypothetical protein
MTGTSVRIDGNTLRLPGGAAVRFVRTLRLPETGTHPLPPGLGEFPVRRVSDYPDTVPEQWRARGGVMLPVYLREAMWLSFGATTEPAALQVGVGKVCAVSGKPWSDRLTRDPQNYVVLPRQPWLDGINSGKGTVRQFVAVPLGLGATVEGQVTGEEVWGGVQLQSFELVEERLAQWREEQRRLRSAAAGPAMGYGAAMPMAMAAAPGGLPGRPAAVGLGVRTGRASLRAPGDTARVAPHHRRGSPAVPRGPRGLHQGGAALVRLLRPGRGGSRPDGRAGGREAGRRLARGRSRAVAAAHGAAGEAAGGRAGQAGRGRRLVAGGGARFASAG